MIPLAVVACQVPVRVLDHDNAGIDHGPDGHGDAAERHDVDVDALQRHDQERHQDAHRERDDGDKTAAEVQQEHHRDQAHDQQLLQETGAQARDRSLDERRPVVADLDLDALR